MDRWDVLIILSAGYIAVMTLVRLMAARRNRVVSEIREQIAAERKKRKQQKQQSAAEQTEDAA